MKTNKSNNLTKIFLYIKIFDIHKNIHIMLKNKRRKKRKISLSLFLFASRSLQRSFNYVEHIKMAEIKRITSLSAF